MNSPRLGIRRGERLHADALFGLNQRETAECLSGSSPSCQTPSTRNEIPPQEAPVAAAVPGENADLAVVGPSVEASVAASVVASVLEENAAADAVSQGDIHRPHRSFNNTNSLGFRFKPSQQSFNNTKRFNKMGSNWTQETADETTKTADVTSDARDRPETLPATEAAQTTVTADVASTEADQPAGTADVHGDADADSMFMFWKLPRG